MSKKKLTQEHLKKLLHYDPETGIFKWKVSRGRYARPGYIAGTLHTKGYRYIKIDSMLYRSSRLAWFYMEGYWPEYQVDHRDRIRDNDKWENLRHATPQCNVRNQGQRKDNTSGIKGISLYKRNNKLRAYISVNLKIINLGYFENLIDAAIARWQAEKKYNFPNCNTTSTAYLYLKKCGLCN